MKSFATAIRLVPLLPALCALLLLASCGPVLDVSRAQSVPATPPPGSGADSGLGELRFPTSGAGAAEEAFIRGLLLLHSFEYGDAREAFREAQRADPGFAMAYWGEALTYDHPLWGEEDLASARRSLEGLGADEATRLARAGTARERAYLEAVHALFGEGSKAERDSAYAAAMERLHRSYPEDENGAALYALALLGSAEGGRDYGKYMEAAAVLEEVFDRHPRHPGALHYLIHSYDDPVHAPLGLRAARRYAEVAPDAVHALHMPTHIFFALGLWDESLELNERSWRTSVERAEARGTAPGGYSFHALEWLHYAYVQLERFDDATRMVERARAAYRARPSRGLAGEVAELSATQLVADPSPDGTVLVGSADVAVLGEVGPVRRAALAFAEGYRALREGRVGEARSRLDMVREAAVATERVAERVMEGQLEGAIRALEGDTAAGLALLRTAVARELATPYEFGPPAILKPSAETLGEVLLELGRPGEAAEAFATALQRAPGRALSVRGLARAERLAAEAGGGVVERARPDDPGASGASARLDAYFRRLAENDVFSGAVLVARGGSVLLRGGYGRASHALEVENTPATRFAIASLTKTFTAASIVMLAERGRLALDDPLTRHLPAFPGGDAITLRHLLLHQSGLANPDYTRALTERTDLEGLVARIAERPPLFEPGTRGAYSNAGYNVLARVIEVASGRPYHAFLQEEIFEPLGMENTGPATSLAVVPGLAPGHIPGPPPLGVAPAPSSDPGFSTGSGDLVSTVDDLRRWGRAVRAERLFRRSELEYPYGWGRLGDDRQAGLEQTGLANGYTASLSVWFADALDVVILGNLESAGWSRWPGVAAALARGEDVELPPRVGPASPMAAAELGRMEGVYSTADHRIEIVAAQGSLWLYLDGWPVPKHLDAPPAGDAWELRSDFGRIRFGPGHPAEWLEWVFDDGSATRYPRS